MTDEIKDEEMPKMSVKTAYNAYAGWVKKNLFTMIGIILILCIALWDVNHTQQAQIEVAKDCIEHYEKQLALSCPWVLGHSYKVADLNRSVENINDWIDYNNS